MQLERNSFRPKPVWADTRWTIGLHITWPLVITVSMTSFALGTISVSYFIRSIFVSTRVNGCVLSVKNYISIWSLGKRPTCRSTSKRTRWRLPDSLRYICMNLLHFSSSVWLAFAYPYPGQSTRRHFCFYRGINVKSFVLPGVFEVWVCWIPRIALINELLPTFDLPMKARSLSSPMPIS